MHPSSTPLTELRINTYEDPFLQHQYVCLGHQNCHYSRIPKYVSTRVSSSHWYQS